MSPVALLNGLTNMVPPGWSPETIADRNIAIICQIESTVSDSAETGRLLGLLVLTRRELAWS